MAKNTKDYNGKRRSDRRAKHRRDTRVPKKRVPKLLDTIYETLKEIYMDRNNWDKFLAQLKGTHQMYKMAEEREREAKLRLDLKRRDAGSYLELLGTNTFTDPKDGFKVWVRKYKKVKITDKKAFMSWLKNNCSPQEVVEFLCPPCTSADLKKFVEQKLEDIADPFYKIDGIEASTSHILVKTKYEQE